MSSVGAAERPVGDLGRAAGSWAAFVLGLGLAGVAGAAARGAGATGDVARAVPAAVVLAVAVPLVLALHGRARWQPVLALRRPPLLLAGALVALAAAAAVLTADHYAGGGVDVVGVEVLPLLRWLLVTLLLAAALEAVPEELALRGGLFGGLRRHVPGWLAGAVTTAGFLAAPASAIWLASRLGGWLGVDTPAPTLAPDGQDPVSYGVLLAAFGVVLLLVRAVTGSLWACVGFHLAFLVVNRLLLGDPATTGVAVATSAGSELLVLGYLALSAAVLGLVLLRRRRGGRRR